MWLELFNGIFDSDLVQVISITQFLLCMGCALVSGWFLAFTYSFKSHYTKSFLITLAILPTVVCVIILMVNGNVGTGVAVAGAFSLVRFRSVPGTAREIGALFIAMGSGLMFGMGYLAYGVIFTVLLSLIFMGYTLSSFGERQASLARTMTITIPEDLNYTDVFTDLMEQYTTKHHITHVKTSNMGSLFKITYDVTLKEVEKEKEFIDQLRCRNGNLEISISPAQHTTSEL